MNFGASSAAKPANFGSGWPFAEEPVRSWAGRWVTEVCKVRVICGRRWHRTIGVVPPAATSGMPTWQPFHRPRIVVAAKRKGKPTTSSVGLARCGLEPVASCAGLIPSPSTPRTTSTPFTSLSPTITSPFSGKQQSGSHHQFVYLRAGHVEGDSQSREDRSATGQKSSTRHQRGSWHLYPCLDGHAFACSVGQRSHFNSYAGVRRFSGCDEIKQVKSARTGFWGLALNASQSSAAESGREMAEQRLRCPKITKYGKIISSSNRDTCNESQRWDSNP